MGSRTMGSGSFSVIPNSFTLRSLRTDTSYRAGAVNPSRGSEEENKSLPVSETSFSDVCAILYTRLLAK